MEALTNSVTLVSCVWGESRHSKQRNGALRRASDQEFELRPQPQARCSPGTRCARGSRRAALEEFLFLLSLSF